MNDIKNIVANLKSNNEIERDKLVYDNKTKNSILYYMQTLSNPICTTQMIKDNSYKEDEQISICELSAILENFAVLKLIHLTPVDGGVSLWRILPKGRSFKF